MMSSQVRCLMSGRGILATGNIGVGSGRLKVGRSWRVAKLHYRLTPHRLCPSSPSSSSSPSNDNCSSPSSARLVLSAFQLLSPRCRCDFCPSIPRPEIENKQHQPRPSGRRERVPEKRRKGPVSTRPSQQIHTFPIVSIVAFLRISIHSRTNCPACCSTPQIARDRNLSSSPPRQRPSFV